MGGLGPPTLFRGMLPPLVGCGDVCWRCCCCMASCWRLCSLSWYENGSEPISVGDMADQDDDGGWLSEPEDVEGGGEGGGVDGDGGSDKNDQDDNNSDDGDDDESNGGGERPEVGKMPSPRGMVLVVEVEQGETPKALSVRASKSPVVLGSEVTRARSQGDTSSWRVS